MERRTYLLATMRAVSEAIRVHSDDSDKKHVAYEYICEV